MNADVIIIGSGYGGLSTAALLANRGKKVLVFEKDKIPGGRAKSIQKDGWTVDYGLHSIRLGEKSPLTEVFKQIGEKVEFIKARPSSYVYSQGKLFRTTRLILNLLSSRAPLKVKFKRLRFLPRFIKAKPEQWYDKSLAEFAKDWLADPRMEKYLRLLAYILMHPVIEEVSAGEVLDHCQAMWKIKKGGAELKGGSHQILQKLISAIEKNGEIMTETPVEKILVERKKVSGVIANGKEYLASTVVYTAPIQQLFQIIEEHFFPKESVEYAKNFVPASGISIDFGLKRTVSKIRGSIICFEPPILGKFPSNLDPALAPGGKQLSSWVLLLPYQTIRNSEEVKNGFKILREFIQKFFPDFFTAIEWERKLVHPIMDGTLLTPQQSYPYRIDVKSSSVEGLFFVGDTVKAKGCSGNIAFASALAASNLILSC